MSEKRIDDAKLGRISGGAEHVEPKPGDDPILGRGNVNPVPPPGGQTLPEADGGGSGTSKPYAK